jgi:hypothetical protein
VYTPDVTVINNTFGLCCTPRKVAQRLSRSLSNEGRAFGNREMGAISFKLIALISRFPIALP